MVDILGTSRFTEAVLYMCYWLNFAGKQKWRKSFWKQRRLYPPDAYHANLKIWAQYGQTYCFSVSPTNMSLIYRAVLQWEQCKKQIQDKTLPITIKWCVKSWDLHQHAPNWKGQDVFWYLLKEMFIFNITHPCVKGFFSWNLKGTSQIMYHTNYCI